MNNRWRAIRDYKKRTFLRRLRVSARRDFAKGNVIMKRFDNTVIGAGLMVEKFIDSLSGIEGVTEAEAQKFNNEIEAICRRGRG